MSNECFFILKIFFVIYLTFNIPTDIQLFSDVRVSESKTRVRGVTCSVSARRWEGDGSMLGLNRVIAKDVKRFTYCCQMRDINSMSRGNALAPNRRNSAPCTVRTSRQRSFNQRVNCLLCSIVRIYEGDGS